jgi:DNA-binding IclR family transcriptional regulator
VGGDSQGYHVNVAMRLLDLLEAFTEGGAHSLTDLSARTGIPKPTAFRLLRTLEDRGYVRRGGGQYALGFRCFILGATATRDRDVRTQVLPHLVALRDATGETVQVACSRAGVSSTSNGSCQNDRSRT